MNATLHRLIVAVSGQGDHLETPQPKRHFWPATVDTDGIPTPTCFCAHVRGGCRQGRACPLLETELANETASDASRTFSGMTAAEKRAARDRREARIQAGAVAVFWTVVGLAGSALVLSLLMPHN